MRMQASVARRLFATARVARLATADAEGVPHLVPVTFAMDGEDVVSAVDAKPKTTAALRRLRNITANPRVSVLVDHYEEYLRTPPAGPVVRIRITTWRGWSASSDVPTPDRFAGCPPYQR